VQIGIALKPIPLSIAAMPEWEMTENTLQLFLL
jgi:hypothetical protein